MHPTVKSRPRVQLGRACILQLTSSDRAVTADAEVPTFGFVFENMALC